MALQRKQGGLQRKKGLRRTPLARRRAPRAPVETRAAPAPQVPEPVHAAFTTLELDPGEDLALVHARYRELIARHHPDKVAALGVEKRRAAEARTRALIDAYELVTAFLAGH